MYNKKEEFFLFSTIFEATMLDRRFFGLVLPSHVGLQFPRPFCSPRLADKPLSIELSVGTFGNSLEVSVEKKSIAIRKTKIKSFYSNVLF